jgi:hypothetical protein
MTNKQTIRLWLVTLPLNLSAPAVFLVALGTCAQFAAAGSISVSTGPTVSLTGVGDLTTGGAQNALVLDQPAPDRVKLFTKEDLVFELTSSTGTIDVGVTGTVSANTGDVALGSYDMNFALTGTGSFDILVSGSVEVFGFSTGFDFSETGIAGPLGPPPVNFQGGDSTDPSPLTISNAPFEATLTLNWRGQVGDQMTIDIPPNSIDFGVIVPEPSSLATLALGVGCCLFALRRKRWRRHLGPHKLPPNRPQC